MARGAIYVLGLSGVLGLVAAAAMTAITGRFPAGALLPALGCMLIGAALLACFERLSRAAVDAALACGTLLSATSLALAGDGGTGWRCTSCGRCCSRRSSSTVAAPPATPR